MTDTDQRADNSIVVCGVGASAGGLEAIEQLLNHAVYPPCVCLVVMQHLSADFDSQLKTLLAAYTDMPVDTIANGMNVEPGRLYVAPPASEVILHGGRFCVSAADPTEPLKRPINKLFRSIAYAYGSRGVGVVVSGTGDDGVTGAGEIYRNGGLVLAQDPEEASFAGMPSALIGTGKVHAVIPIRECCERISCFLDGIQSERGEDKESDEPPNPESVAMSMLADRFGVDFDQYKTSTFRRRLERRRIARGCNSIDEYVGKLADDANELNTLFCDQLIRVTEFFRDPDAFIALKKVLADHLDPNRRTFRVWIPGCASGQEAYSLAILLAEVRVESKSEIDLEIVATDVHPANIERARRGVYSGDDVSDIGPQLRKKYFRQTAGGFEVCDEIRAYVTFEVRNLLSAPPPVAMDLVSCRNLLIYLTPEAQQQVLNVIHFSLRFDGLLFLGKSETVTAFQDDFDALDTPNRIYRKRRSMSSIVRTPARPLVRTPRDLEERQREPYLDRVIEQFVPPSFVVDDRFALLHSFNDAASMLKLRSGKTSAFLPDLLPKRYRAAALSALIKARSDGTARQLVAADPDDGLDGARKMLVVDRLSPGDSESVAYLVQVGDFEEDVEVTGRGRESGSNRVSNERFSLLERQLDEAREDLQATIEELETSNEELQATNEELVASNQELFSSNAELHATTEKLEAVNVEYQLRVKEVENLHANIELLLEQTGSGALYIDADMRIVQFTDRASTILNLEPQDLGRELAPFISGLGIDNLETEIREAIASGKKADFRASLAPGTAHLLRVVGLQSAGQPSGCVLLLVDISEVHQKTRENEQLAAIVKQAQEPIISRSPEGKILSWNRGAELLFGYSEAEAIGQPIDLIVPADLREADFGDTYRQITSLGGGTVETRRRAKDGSEKTVSLTMFPVFAEDGTLESISSIDYDLTEQKKAETELKKLVQQREQFLALLSHEIRNPVMTLRSASTILAEEDVDAAMRREAIDSIRRQTYQLSALLEDLLDASRMRRDRLEMKLRPADLCKAIHAAVLDTKDISASKGVEIRYQAPDAELRLNGDPSRLRQMVTNLLSNAIRYSEPDSSVRCKAFKDGDEIVLEVCDSGLGMEPGTLKRVFEPFFQADKHIGGRASMGLGLALVKSIVVGHGGEISAFSEGKGKGSRFEVRLPAIEAIERVGSSDRPESPGVQRGKKIFLVDDDNDGRRALAFLLSRRGHDVTEVATGGEALELVPSLDADVAILDIGLPDVSGLDVGRAIDALPAETRPLLVALSGFGQASDLEKTERAGFDLHLVKPVDVAALDEVLADNAG